MTRLIAVLLSAVMLCSASPVQNSEQYRKCVQKATTQTAMHVCANEEAQPVDTELNDIYQRLLSANGNQSDVVERIRAMQRAWITYRDAYMEAMYPAKKKQVVYGSSFPIDVDLVRAKLTREQTSALRDLLKQHSGSTP